VRGEELESPEELQAVEPAVAAEPGQRSVEAGAHGVCGIVADVLEHEEQQAAVELDIKDDVRGGIGHTLSFRTCRQERKSRTSGSARCR
jgi:hypothetical protein